MVISACVLHNLSIDQQDEPLGDERIVDDMLSVDVFMPDGAVPDDDMEQSKRLRDILMDQLVSAAPNDNEHLLDPYNDVDID